jgi:glycerophosphoryl diester phosphodiesterase
MEIIAHRGASWDAPENTLAALELAWQQQADAAEIDVHLCKSGEIVVMHDANTLRTTGVGGEIAARTLPELRALDAGVWKSRQFAGEPIPTLDEVLQGVPPGKRLFIEIKSKTPAILAPLRASLQCAGVLPEQITLIGFDYDLMKEVKAALPQTGVLWLSGTPGAASLDEMIALCRSADFAGLDLSWRWPLDGTGVRQLRDAGLQLFVWTVDEAEVARHLAALGVDGITTNRPAWLREQLRSERE